MRSSQYQTKSNLIQGSFFMKGWVMKQQLLLLLLLKMKIWFFSDLCFRKIKMVSPNNSIWRLRVISSLVLAWYLTTLEVKYVTSPQPRTITVYGTMSYGFNVIRVCKNVRQDQSSLTLTIMSGLNITLKTLSRK